MQHHVSLLLRKSYWKLQWIFQIIAKDPWERPSAPGQVAVSEVTKRSVKLAWSPPTTHGGDAIGHYPVEYRERGTFKWIPANEGERTTEPFYKVTGLHSDLDYEFRVAARNRAGVGPFSDISSPVHVKDPVGKDTLDLNWNLKIFFSCVWSPSVFEKCWKSFRFATKCYKFEIWQL